MRAPKYLTVLNLVSVIFAIQFLSPLVHAEDKWDKNIPPRGGK